MYECFSLFRSTVNSFLDFWIVMYFAIPEIQASAEFLNDSLSNVVFFGALLPSPYTHCIGRPMARIIYNCFIRFNRELNENVTHRLYPAIFIPAV